jgi:hypothetical protein
MSREYEQDYIIVRASSNENKIFKNYIMTKFTFEYHLSFSIHISSLLFDCIKRKILPHNDLLIE